MKLRKARELPSWTKSSTASEEPNRDTDVSASALPQFAKLRRLIALPKCTKSSTARAEPNRATENTESALPQCP